MNTKNDTVQKDPEMMRHVERVAVDYFGIHTLKEQKSDRLDFHEVACWNVEAALIRMYELGRASKKS